MTITAIERLPRIPWITPAFVGSEEEGEVTNPQTRSVSRSADPTSTSHRTAPIIAAAIPTARRSRTRNNWPHASAPRRRRNSARSIPVRSCISTPAGIGAR